MVHFIFNDNTILNWSEFEVNTPSRNVSFVARFDYDSFSAERKISVTLEKLNDFRSNLFYYNLKQRSEVEFYDSYDLLYIKIERDIRGDRVTIIMGNGIESSCEISFNAKYYMAEPYRLETIYDELFSEMELLGLNGEKQ